MTPETKRIADTLLVVGPPPPSHVGSEERRRDPSNPPADTTTEELQRLQYRRALSQAITLLESQAPARQEQGNALLLYLQKKKMKKKQPQQQQERILPQKIQQQQQQQEEEEKQEWQQQRQHNTKLPLSSSLSSYSYSSFCIGIAGPPGVGKSTLIEALGRHILSSFVSPEGDDSSHTNHDYNNTNSNDSNDNNNKSLENDGLSTSSSSLSSSSWFRLAVLCVDPSSVLSGGSILGDATRMPSLTQHEHVLVRPVPSSMGTLGGLAGSRTWDVVQLFGLSNIPVILLETVGLGQSEVDVAHVADVTVLLLPPGGGDALQGAKKGILEVANVVCVTKADGETEALAQRTAAEYQSALGLTQWTRQENRRRTSHHAADNNDRHHQDQEPSKVLLVSSATGRGVPELWQTLVTLQQRQRNDQGTTWQNVRQSQAEYWMWQSFTAQVQRYVREQWQQQQQHDQDHHHHNLDLSKLPARVAASRLFRQLFSSSSSANTTTTNGGAPGSSGSGSPETAGFKEKEQKNKPEAAVVAPSTTNPKNHEPS
ncbi:hypothetical protein ACA910_003687 [Epithemia clementina (nom. ined.)]